MNLPNFVISILKAQFSDAEVEMIDRNWYQFICISLSNSAKEELVREGKTILALLNYVAK